MNPLSTLLLALAMSTDAFAAAVVKGAALHRPHWREAVRAGLIFGCIEATTPIVGWALGSLAASYVEAWDHWIAFGLLGVLGAKMIWEGLQAADEPVEERPTRHPFWMLALTGFATSIDAMAVGVGLAFLDVAILPVAATIGLTTFLLVKDRASCCFGKRPQINHFIEVKLKPGRTADFSSDPVTVRGILKVDDRWDGDWQLGLYWMEGAEVVK